MRLIWLDVPQHQKNQNAYIKRIKEKQFEVKIQNEAHQHLEGKFEINRLYKDVKTLRVNTKRLSWHAQQMLIMTHYSNCR